MRICLLAEGCYPYVVGGVSSWIQMLISGLPEHEFVIYSIGAEEKDRGNYKYKLPDNVVEVREVFLDTVLNMNTNARKNIHLTEEEKSVFKRLLLHDENVDLKMLWNIFQRKTNKKDFLEIFMSADFFECIISSYKESYAHLAFTDYFWCVRSLLLPFFFLLQENAPEADVYHSVATGYCGLIGTLAAKMFNKPYMISEHGIYSREREEEIIKSDWVTGDLKTIWINYFYQIAKINYKAADQILALYTGATKTEIALGCAEDKIAVVPNGVHLERFLPLKHIEDPDGWINIGAVIRVVPIKDVMTMLRAFSIVKERIPNSRLYVMGNQEENPEYYHECLQLVDDMHIKDVIFPGTVQVTEYLPKMDICLLSSISEGMPLAVLEGLAAGVPFVTTNVGCCYEILYKCAEDDDLGQAGIVVPVMDFEGMAEGIIELAGDKQKRLDFAAAGRERVIKYYNYDLFINTYRDYYKKMLTIKG